VLIQRVLRPFQQFAHTESSGGVVLLACTAIALIWANSWWDDPTLAFGFLPIGLAYHVGFSIAASALWFAYIKFAWPTHVEEFAEGDQTIPPESKPPAP
jgi:Na+/H+ antiporter NhaA